MSAEPLTAKEEADWREWVAKPGPREFRVDVGRFLATLDAARAAPQADAGTLGEALRQGLDDQGYTDPHIVEPILRAQLAALAASSPATAGLQDDRVVRAFDLLGGMWSWSEDNGYLATGNTWWHRAGRLLREVVGRPAQPPAETP